MKPAFHSIFALFHRALRVDSRSVSTYLVRSLCVLVGMMGVLAAHATPFGEAGLSLLWWIVWLDIFVITVGAGSYFSSVITEEREDMTLGLLRMTGLSPVNILLGKSAGRLVWALLVLAVQLPLIVLAISFGGISIGQVLSVFAVLGAFILFVACLGLLVSVISKRNRTATVLVVLISLLLWLVPGLTLLIMNGLQQSGDLAADSWIVRLLQGPCEWLWAANPYRETANILAFDFTGGPSATVIQFLIGGSLLCFVLAWLIFRRSRLFDAPTTQGRSLRLERLFRKRGSRTVWAWPVAWKDFFYLAGGKTAIVVKTLVYTALVLGFWFLLHKSGDSDPGDEVASFAFGFGLFFLVIELGVLAGKVFRVEISEQTLPNLVLLPNSWILQKLIGCALTVTPVLGLLSLPLFLVPELYVEFFEDALDEIGFYAFCMYVVMGIVLTAYLSLWLRWGAFAAAAVVCVFAAVVGGMSIALLSIAMQPEPEVVFGFAFLVAAGVTVTLATAIPKRLRVLAAR